MKKSLKDFIGSQEDVPTCYYFFEFATLIHDVKDYLDFSEKNIESLYRLELDSIKHREDDFPPEYVAGMLHSLESDAEHRFMVSLPLKIRYAAVLGLVTSVEWAGLYFKKNTIKTIETEIDKEEKLKTGKNKTVIRLEVMSRHAEIECTKTIEDLKSLIYIRNSIAHSAGLEEYDDHQDTLPETIKCLDGFTLSEGHYCLGRLIAIEKGAIDDYIKSMELLVRNILEAADKKNLIVTARI